MDTQVYVNSSSVRVESVDHSHPYYFLLEHLCSCFSTTSVFRGTDCWSCCFFFCFRSPSTKQTQSKIRTTPGNVVSGIGSARPSNRCIGFRRETRTPNKDQIASVAACQIKVTWRCWPLTPDCAYRVVRWFWANRPCHSAPHHHIPRT